MKAGRSTDGIVYPDVGHQISDLVSQQAEETPEGVKAKAIVPRRRVDEYQGVVSTGLSRLDQLIRKDLPPLSNFGYVPRPEGWNGAPAIFHDPKVLQLRTNLCHALRADCEAHFLQGVSFSTKPSRFTGRECRS